MSHRLGDELLAHKGMEDAYDPKPVRKVIHALLRAERMRRDRCECPPWSECRYCKEFDAYLDGLILYLEKLETGPDVKEAVQCLCAFREKTGVHEFRTGNLVVHVKTVEEWNQAMAELRERKIFDYLEEHNRFMGRKEAES